MLPWAAGAGALALYAATCARTVTFGDSGELLAASWRCGIAHPPGYPVYTAIAWGAMHAIPLGEPALGASLLSALSAAAACGVLAAWARAVYRSPAAAAATAAVFATCGIVWSVATIAEVYALHALLLSAFLSLSWRLGNAPDEGARRAAWRMGSIVLGLGLAHHPTIVVALPAAFVLAWPGRRALRFADVAAGVAVVAGVVVLADGSLLLRARRDPDAWGGLTSAHALLAHVSAARYRLYDLGWAGLARVAAWSRLAATLARSLAGAGLIAGVAGAVAPGRGERGADRLVRFGLVVLAACGLAFVLRYATEDPEPYALPIVVAIAMLAGRAVAVLENRFPGRVSRVGAWTAAAALAVIPAAYGWNAHDLSQDRGARLAAEDMLATLPGDAILFTDGDDAFLLAYATQVLRLRPDATIYDRNGSLFSRYLPRPSQDAAFGVIDEDARRGTEMTIAAAELARPGGRPVLFTVWPGYEPPGAMTFTPVGLYQRVVRSGGSPVDAASVWSRYHERDVLASARHDGGPFALSVAASYPIMRGEAALARGRIEDAADAFAAAVAVAGENETVLNTLGTAWARRGRLKEAEAMFERAVAAKPVSVRAWMNLAQARALLGDREGAAAATARARALSEKSFGR